MLPTTRAWAQEGVATERLDGRALIRSGPNDAPLRAMEDLVRSGRVRYVACSNYRAWEVVQPHN